jgi:hypothetical protein
VIALTSMFDVCKYVPYSVPKKSGNTPIQMIETNDFREKRKNRWYLFAVFDDLEMMFF